MQATREVIIVIRKKIENLSPISIILLVSIIVVLFLSIYLTVFVCAEQIEPSTAPQAEIDVPQMTASHLQASGTLSKPSYLFLVAGRDAVSGLTDVILLVKFDAEQKIINIIQIPRDTYLRYTDRAYKKINAATYVLGGLEGLAELLEQTWSIDIDYTVEFTIETFSHLIDLIGGVPINIPYDMDYEDASQELYIHLKAGENILYGNEAVQFVRFRSGYVQGDIARIDAQKIFLAALAQKITSGVGTFKLPAIIGALIGEVKTNLSLSDCISFVRAALNVDMSNIVMVTLSGKDARTGGNSGAWYYIINRSAALEIINRYLITSENIILSDNFDSDRLFSNTAYPHFEEIYYAESYSIQEYRADDINKDGIDICLVDQ